VANSREAAFWIIIKCLRDVRVLLRIRDFVMTVMDL
jgi:hypothetical protein